MWTSRRYYTPAFYISVSYFMGLKAALNAVAYFALNYF